MSLLFLVLVVVASMLILGYLESPAYASRQLMRRLIRTARLNERRRAQLHRQRYMHVFREE